MIKTLRKTRSKTWCISLLALLLPFSAQAESATSTHRPTPVVMISLDGFSYDYLELYQPPNLLKLARHGSHTRLAPVYPSKTFPNHLSLATGLRPTRHGIVDNHFYDQERGEHYHMGAAAADSTWISAGTPLWNLAEQHGLIAATYFWPESDARINGMTPSYFYTYSHNAPTEQRIKQIVSWLQLPEVSRPSLIMSYFHQVDSAGHRYGPDSPETGAAVLLVDKLIGQLVDQLAEAAIPAQIILVADHGMAETRGEHAIEVSGLPAPEGFERVHGSSRVVYYAKRGTSADQIIELRQALKQLKLPALSVMSEQELSLAGYEQTPRSGDIILEARPPAFFTSRPPVAGKRGGAHGYIGLPEMDGLFLAAGPGIARQANMPRLSVVDIYPLVTALLGLPVTGPIDGDPAAVSPLLLQ